MTLVLDDVTRQMGGETHIYPTSLELAPGSVNVLLGATLAGKTTLMRLMAGLDKPESGRVLLDGVDITGVSVRKRDVAMVYQQFINYPSFTVYENIASPLRRQGMARDAIDARVRSVAETLHITPLLDRLPNELSGGQQQRTALARALAKDSGLLLLDEPLVNLDYKLREELRDELRLIFDARKSIVVYATTEPLEALALGGNIVVLDEGRALQTGPTSQVYREPATVRVGEVFSDPPINEINGRVENGVATLGQSVRFKLTPHMAGLGDGNYRFGIRANQLFVNRQSDTDVAIQATVELAEISGSETFIHAAHSGVSWVAQEKGVHDFALGQAMEFFLAPDGLFVFDAAGNLAVAPVQSGANGKEG